MLFNEILKGLREERGLTQKNIADACKVNPTCICQLETGSRSPTGSTLLSLADFFNCSIDYLLGREDDFGNITIQTEKPDPLPQDEQRLIDTYRKLDTVNKMHVSAYAEVRLEEQENRTPSTIRKK